MINDDDPISKNSSKNHGYHHNVKSDINDSKMIYDARNLEQGVEGYV